MFSILKPKTGVNDVFVITLESGFKAIFKPSSSSYAEVAAYKASQFLKLSLVPPTIIRTNNNKTGSLQFLVEPAEKVDCALLNAEQQSALHIFYYIFGQWDNHCDNTLIQKSENKNFLACIDNAAFADLQFCEYGDFPFVYMGGDLSNFYKDKNLQFPYNQAQTLQDFSLEQAQALFGDYLSDSRIKQLWTRNKKITYCVWQNCLWIQMYKHCSWARANFTSEYYPETINSYKNLTKDALKTIWSDAPYKKHVKKLIKLTLERKEQLFDYFS